MGCDELKEINISEGVKSITYEAFYGVENLIKLSIPSTITEIGGDVIHGCNNLKELYCYIKEPWEVILGSGKANCTLYVPKGTKAKYEALSEWNQFKEIVEMEE